MDRKGKKYKCMVCEGAVVEHEICKKVVDWDNGAVFDIAFSYPTLLDGVVFSAALCVPCADKLATKGIIKMIHNEFEEGKGKKKYIPLPK